MSTKEELLQDIRVIFSLSGKYDMKNPAIVERISTYLAKNNSFKTQLGNMYCERLDEIKAGKQSTGCLICKKNASYDGIVCISCMDKYSNGTNKSTNKPSIEDHTNVDSQVSEIESDKLQDIAIILSLSEKFNLRDPVDVRKISTYLLDNNPFKTQLGNTYSERIDEIKAGNHCKECLICKKNASIDGVVCSSCMNQYSNGTKDFYNDKDIFGIGKWWKKRKKWQKNLIACCAVVACLVCVVYKVSEWISIFSEFQTTFGEGNKASLESQYESNEDYCDDVQISEDFSHYEVRPDQLLHSIKDSSSLFLRFEQTSEITDEEMQVLLDTLPSEYNIYKYYVYWALDSSGEGMLGGKLYLLTNKDGYIKKCQIIMLYDDINILAAASMTRAIIESTLPETLEGSDSVDNIIDDIRDREGQIVKIGDYFYIINNFYNDNTQFMLFSIESVNNRGDELLDEAIDLTGKYEINTISAEENESDSFKNILTKKQLDILKESSLDIDDEEAFILNVDDASAYFNKVFSETKGYKIQTSVQEESQIARYCFWAPIGQDSEYVYNKINYMIYVDQDLSEILRSHGLKTCKCYGCMITNYYDMETAYYVVNESGRIISVNHGKIRIL